MRQRGEFTINPDSHLGRKGLNLAMLGRSPNGSTVFNSGNRPYLHGAMTGIDADDWHWSQELGRWYLDFASGDNYVDFGYVPIEGTAGFSIMGIIRPDGGPGIFDGPILGWGDTGADHDYFELNIDNTGFMHSNQASTSNTATFSGAFATDKWESFLYVHNANTNCNGDRLWVGKREATGGGVGTTVLDIAGGADTARVGASSASGIFNYIGQISDLLLFEEELGEPEAMIIANLNDPTLGGLLIEGTHANPYDLEGVR